MLTFEEFVKADKSLRNAWVRAKKGSTLRLYVRKAPDFCSHDYDLANMNNSRPGNKELTQFLETWERLFIFRIENIFEERLVAYFKQRGYVITNDTHPVCMVYSKEQYEMMSRPKVIVMCGSSRFVQVMAVAAWLLEKQGHITMGLHLLPAWYPDCPPDHLAEQEGVADEMDELHKRKIDLADEIFVIDWNGYIGDSTRSEIEYAHGRDMAVRYISHSALLEPIMNMLQAYKARADALV